MAYEEITLDQYINSENKQQESTNLRGNFGCCDKYNQCSIEGKCVQSQEISEHCVYKTHLEKGEIYYTRASASFSQEKYDEIEKLFLSLSNLEKEAFLELVGFVIYVHRCAKHFLCIKNEGDFKNLYSCVKNSSFFLTANPHILVGILFDKKIMSIQNCQVFCDKYSDIQFSTEKIDLPFELQYSDKDYLSGEEHLIKNLNKQGKEKHEKQNEYKLKKWKDFFLTSGTLALNKFQDFFAYINFLPNYTIVMEKWDEDHQENIPHKLSDLKYIAVETTDKDGKIINSYKKLECFVK